jgi:histidinol-phosphate phosphatase family protein
MPAIEAVLFDRDDTITVDDPAFNGDPELVRPVPGAHEAVAQLRAAGIAIGVITNQSGVGRGLITTAQVEAVNARVDELLGPFDTWQYCPHTPADQCTCRKPAAGMVLRAADELDVQPDRIVVIGDTGADVAAAHAAGAAGILIPTARTLPTEVESAPIVLPDLAAAVAVVLAIRQGDAA